MGAINAFLCSAFWFSIDPSLQPSYQAFDICYDVWSKAKKVYSNDVHHIYSVITNMLSTKLENMDM